MIVYIQALSCSDAKLSRHLRAAGQLHTSFALQSRIGLFRELYRQRLCEDMAMWRVTKGGLPIATRGLSPGEMTIPG